MLLGACQEVRVMLSVEALSQGVLLLLAEGGYTRLGRGKAG